VSVTPGGGSCGAGRAQLVDQQCRHPPLKQGLRCEYLFDSLPGQNGIMPPLVVRILNSLKQTRSVVDHMWFFTSYIGYFVTFCPYAPACNGATKLNMLYS
jgi:hypothetical protein